MALTTLVQNSLPTIEAPTHYENGLSIGINNVQFPLQVDVPVSPIYTFKIVPASIDTDCIAAAQSLGTGTAGGNLTLQTTVQGTAPNIISQPITYRGQTGVLLDCERALAIVFSSPTQVATVLTVSGYDYRGVPTQYTSGTLATGTDDFSETVPFSVITSVNFSVNPFISDASKTISVGTNQWIALPYLLTNDDYVISTSWAGSPLSSSSGAVYTGYNWRLNSSYGTYSARGFVDCGLTAPNGTNLLVITYYVYGADAELSNQISNKNQSALKIVNVQKNASSSYPTSSLPLNVPVFVYPKLLPQDLTGLQLNTTVALTSQTTPDAQFFLNYKALIAG